MIGQRVDIIKFSETYINTLISLEQNLFRVENNFTTKNPTWVGQIRGMFISLDASVT